MKLMDEVMLQEKRMIADRRYLHENPELSNQEYHTTEFIRKRLQEFGVEIENLNLKTGVSALIRGKGNGKTICIRHDIDALPIQEQTGLDFSSKNEGVSHSCGHDIHIVTALYSAKILQQHKDELNGNVRIVFQPAEENVTGAKAVIAAGLMQKEPLNDIVVGLHTHPQTPVHTRKSRRQAAADHRAAVRRFPAESPHLQSRHRRRQAVRSVSHSAGYLRRRQPPPPHAHGRVFLSAPCAACGSAA